MSEAEKLAQFQGLTGAPESLARSYLEAASWDIEAAAETFFETTSHEGAMPGLQPGFQGNYEENDGSGMWDPASFQHQAQPNISGMPSNAPANRFATLGDYGDSQDDDDDEGRQNYFAGGEKSGISIQNPNSSAQDEIRNILQAATRNAPPSSVPQPPAQQPHFTGTGYTLGSDTQPSQPVIASTSPTIARRSGPVRRQLTLWRNGFSIDDGPLFPFSDPESVEILREIRMGRVPRSVAGVDFGQDVEMRLEKRDHEDYIPQKKPAGRGGSFIGQGNRLGSAVPGEPMISPAAATPSTQSDAEPTPEIDTSLPRTTIQLRFVDGTRLVTQFNLSSTMDDVYAFVGRARPTHGQEFVLQTIFPTRLLERGSKTIEEEGLKGGTVVMRWKS